MYSVAPHKLPSTDSPEGDADPREPRKDLHHVMPNPVDNTTDINNYMQCDATAKQELNLLAQLIGSKPVAKNTQFQISLFNTGDEEE